MSFSTVPLGHKFTAVLLAAAVGGGVYMWFRHNAVQKASTAELSFDMHAARRIDPGFVQAPKPAVVFAQSILTDQKIAELSKPAYLSTSAMMPRVGEFRSRLVLTQPSAEVLGVRFNDPDPAKAVATANAVASALTAWAPSPNGPAPSTLPEPAAPPRPAAATPPAAKAAPVAAPQKPVVRHDDQAAGTLAAGLGELQTQLSSTNQKLDALNSGGGSRGRAYEESEQQELLKSQVRAAEKKVDDLRAQATGKDAKDRLGKIQEALHSVLSGGVGVSASELRRERGDLTGAIGVVEEQHEAVEREEAQSTAGSGSETAAAAAPAAPAPTAPAPAGPAAITEQPVNSQAGSGSGSGAAAPAAQPESASSAATPPESDAAMLNPLHMTRLAGPAAPPILWPAVAAGVLCGLLYWLIAAAASPRPVDYEEGEVDVSPHYGQRFITPDLPVAPVIPAEEPLAGGVFGSGWNRRASFTYEPAPGEGGGAETANSSGERSETARVEEGEGPLVRENLVEMADPWADLIKSALSETEVGKRFEGDVAADGERARPSQRKDDETQPSNRSDRLAG